MINASSIVIPDGNGTSLDQSYNLTKQSLFVDIGCGFGKAVLHAYAVTEAFSLGIEAHPGRIHFC
jgi:tRNA G46 methylase TrmB